MQEGADSGPAIQPLVHATPSASTGTNNFFVRLRHVSHVAMFLSGQNFLFGNKLAEILVAHSQHSVVDLALQIVHRARGGARNARAIYGEYCRVTWTDELLLRFDPRNRTPEERTNWRQHAQHSALHRQN